MKNPFGKNLRQKFNAFASKVRGMFKGNTVDAEENGYAILRDASRNKSTAFTSEERDALNLRGLLPYAVDTTEEQHMRVAEHLKRKTTDIDKYIYLSALQDRNEKLFYQTALANIEDIMPLIYTPTVGQACREFAHIFRQPRGIYITPDDKGRIRDILDNWPADDVRVVVVTDGQRILGLGDLGANGMGIPIGKLALYTLCGGVDPAKCLPVMFDVGTGNEALRNDPLYLGYPHPRVQGTAYDELMEEFITALRDKYPKVLVQFEDFLTPNAYRLLNKYRGHVNSFNDDIQGTAAVALSGILASTRLTNVPFKDQRILFLGAGSAATGIADLMVTAFKEQGLSEEEARKRLWLVDVEGLVTKNRATLADNKKAYAHDHAPMNLLDAINDIRPTAIIGATGVGGAFTEEVVKAMAAINEKPVIFALSNPTHCAECTAEQAYQWTDGRAVFASGSPFADVTLNGKTFKTGQANNAYIFPGLGLGAVLAETTAVTDSMFLASAKILAGMVSDDDLKSGRLYPPLTEIRKVSAAIAKAVIETAVAENVGTKPNTNDLAAYIEKKMYDPAYTASPIAPKNAYKTKP